MRVLPNLQFWHRLDSWSEHKAGASPLSAGKCKPAQQKSILKGKICPPCAGKKFPCPTVHEDCYFLQQMSCSVSQEHSPSHPAHFALSKRLPGTHCIVPITLLPQPCRPTPLMVLPAWSKLNPPQSVKRLFVVLLHLLPSSDGHHSLDLPSNPLPSAKTIWPFIASVHQAHC